MQLHQRPRIWREVFWGSLVGTEESNKEKQALYVVGGHFDFYATEIHIPYSC